VGKAQVPTVVYLQRPLKLAYWCGVWGGNEFASSFTADNMFTIIDVGLDKASATYGLG
jgi:hypothetical protein